jgi:hypothetical protein
MNLMKNGQLVVVCNTGSPLDELVCSVAGIASESQIGIGTTYIIKMPTDFKLEAYPYSCIALTESCLYRTD